MIAYESITGTYFINHCLFFAVGDNTNRGGKINNMNDETNCEFRLYDIFGRKLDYRSIKPGLNQFVMDVSLLPNGIITALFISDGKIIEASKLFKNR